MSDDLREQVSWEPKSDLLADVEVVCDNDKGTFCGITGTEVGVKWVGPG